MIIMQRAIALITSPVGLVVLAAACSSAFTLAVLAVLAVMPHP